MPCPLAVQGKIRSSHASQPRGPNSLGCIICVAMAVVQHPVPVTKPALVQAAVRRANKAPKAVAARRKKGKWSLDGIFVPGVGDTQFQPFTPEMQGDQLAAFAASPENKTIYTEPGQPKDSFALAHEMGHLIDAYATDKDHQNFMRIMGFKPGEAWDQGTGTDGGFHSPSEFFADYYSSVVNKVDPRRSSQAAYANNINRKRLRQFALALAQFGRYYQLGAYKEPTWPSSP